MSHYIIDYSNNYSCIDRNAADAFVLRNKQATIYQNKSGESRIAIPVWRGKEMKIVHRKITLVEGTDLFIIRKKTLPLFDTLSSNCYAIHTLNDLNSRKIDDLSISAKVFKTMGWAKSRAKEIPFLLTHPRVIVEKYHRKRVRDAMEGKTPKKIIVKLSEILPAHPLEGNAAAEAKNKERIAALKKNRVQFDDLFSTRQPITQEFIDSIMESTSPIQLAYDERSGKCIAFDGNSRLIAIKRFFKEVYPDKDPEIEINVYKVDSQLMKPALPDRDFSYESSVSL